MESHFMSSKMTRETEKRRFETSDQPGQSTEQKSLDLSRYKDFIDSITHHKYIQFMRRIETDIREKSKENVNEINSFNILPKHKRQRESLNKSYEKALEHFKNLEYFEISIEAMKESIYNILTSDNHILQNTAKIYLMDKKRSPQPTSDKGKEREVDPQLIRSITDEYISKVGNRFIERCRKKFPEHLATYERALQSIRTGLENKSPEERDAFINYYLERNNPPGEMRAIEIIFRRIVDKKKKALTQDKGKGREQPPDSPLVARPSSPHDSLMFEVLTSQDFERREVSLDLADKLAKINPTLLRDAQANIWEGRLDTEMVKHLMKTSEYKSTEKINEMRKIKKIT